MMQTLSAIDSLRKKVMLENNLISYNANSQAIAILLLDSCSYSEILVPYRERMLTQEDVTVVYQLPLCICYMLSASRLWQVNRQCNLHSLYISTLEEATPGRYFLTRKKEIGHFSVYGKSSKLALNKSNGICVRVCNG